VSIVTVYITLRWFYVGNWTVDCKKPFSYPFYYDGITVLCWYYCTVLVLLYCDGITILCCRISMVCFQICLDEQRKCLAVGLKLSPITGKSLFSLNPCNPTSLHCKSSIFAWYIWWNMSPIFLFRCCLI